MPTFEFTQETMPSPDELLRLLQEAEADYDPLEELLALERELAALEQQHGLTSAELYEQYQAGEAGDAIDLTIWVSNYETYQRLKKAIANSLQMVLVQPTV